MKQVVSNYSYSPATNVLTLSGVNIDQDQLLLVVAPGVGRTMYNFASGVTGVVSAGVNTRVTLNASTANLTTTSPLVIYYDDQAISGTVTANVFGSDYVGNPLRIPIEVSSNGIGDSFVPIGFNNDGDASQVSIQSPLPVAANLNNVVADNGASSTLKAIAIGHQSDEGTFSHTGLLNPLPVNINANAQVPRISGTVTVGNSVNIGSLPVQLSTTTIGGTARLNVTLSSATTIGATAPSYGNLYGGSDGTNLRAILVDSSGRTTVTGSVNILGTPSVTMGAISGTVTANISGTVPVSISSVTIGNTVTVAGTVTANVSSTTVTVSALPSGALTTRFGSVVTANSAGITTAVTNTSRKYLLAQNISTGTVTIGIGFSPTTTQGIQLTAGAGLTFDSFVPTGAVYWLGATTGAAYTILEG